MSAKAEPEERGSGLSVEGDRPIARNADDRLGFGVYADALSRLIQHAETETPLVLAIHARWGAGKSSLANLVESRLTQQREQEGEEPYVICRFNAWMHDDAASLRTALSATIAKDADRARPYWRRLFEPLPLSLLSPVERAKVYGPIYVLGTLALLVAWMLAMRVPGAEGWVRTLFGKIDAPEGAKNTAVTAAVGLLVGTLPKLRAMGTAVAQFVRRPLDAANSGSIAAARAQLGELIAQAVRHRGGRFVVFVDDVERCQPPKPIEVLEAVNQLLDHPGVVVVLLGDMAAVAANAGLKYKDLACVHNPDGLTGLKEGDAMRLYGYRYMQKIVQLQFDVPTDAEITAVRMDGLDVPPTLPQGWEPPQDMAPSETKPWTTAGDVKRSVLAVLFAPWIWFVDQIGFPAHVFTSDERVRIHLTTAYQAMLALLQAVAAIVFLVQAVIKGLDPLRAVVGVLVCWALGNVLAFAARREFVRRVRAALARWVGKLANAGAGAAFDPDAGREALFEHFLGRAQMTAAHKERLRRDMAHAGDLFEAAFRRRSEESRLADDHDAARAFDHAIPFLPPLPRNAKRLRNAVRLATYVLKARGVVPYPVSPEAVGKWAALREGWPDVAERLAHDPGLLRRLEPLDGLVAASDVPEIVRTELAAYADDGRLKTLLCDPFPIRPLVRCAAKTETG